MDEAIIQKIMEEVIKTLNKQGVITNPETEGMTRMLVIGDFNDVPSEEQSKYMLAGIEDYEQYKNIRRYEKVCITKLSLTDLSDMAMGRDGSLASCAVVNALLRGIDVVLLEKALWHRKLAGKGSAKLYGLIENNVRQLESYGVKVISEPKQIVIKESKPPKFNPPKAEAPKGSMVPNSARLITEQIAMDLVKENSAQVCVAKDAIITPSAWDIFAKNKTEVIKG